MHCGTGFTQAHGGGGTTAVASRRMKKGRARSRPFDANEGRRYSASDSSAGSPSDKPPA
jgi:hypothetical protein